MASPSSAQDARHGPHSHVRRRGDGPLGASRCDGRLDRGLSSRGGETAPETRSAQGYDVPSCCSLASRWETRGENRSSPRHRGPLSFHADGLETHHLPGIREPRLRYAEPDPSIMRHSCASEYSLGEVPVRANGVVRYRRVLSRPRTCPRGRRHDERRRPGVLAVFAVSAVAELRPAWQ